VNETLKNLLEYLQNKIDSGEHKIFYNDLGWDIKTIDCINAINEQQEEIERLNNIIKGLDNTIENLEEVIEHKDSIINKANKYLEKHTDKIKRIIIPKIDFNYKVLSNILKGSEKE
jgi:hypothetical protein